jgi:hypothetical protein
MRIGVVVTPRPFFPREREPIPIVLEEPQDSVLMGEENFTPHPTPNRGLISRVVRPVATRYTEYAVEAHQLNRPL